MWGEFVMICAIELQFFLLERPIIAPFQLMVPSRNALSEPVLKVMQYSKWGVQRYFDASYIGTVYRIVNFSILVNLLGNHINGPSVAPKRDQ